MRVREVDCVRVVMMQRNESGDEGMKEESRRRGERDKRSCVVECSCMLRCGELNGRTRKPFRGQDWNTSISKQSYHVI